MTSTLPRKRYYQCEGRIKDKTAIMHAAVTHRAATYLHDRATLIRWELMGLVYVSGRFDDFDQYKATNAGIRAYCKGTLP
jgi:hypothetical protein